MYRDTRMRSAIHRIIDNPAEVFGWHSLACTCESCLDADAVLDFYGGYPNPKIDISGIVSDNQLVPA